MTEQEEAALKEEARLKKLLAKYELEVDADTNAILAYVAQGKTVSGVSKLITKDWAISALLKFYQECTRASTRQRAFEFICELCGLVPKGTAKDSQLLDVVIGSDSAVE